MLRRHPQRLGEGVGLFTLCHPPPQVGGAGGLVFKAEENVPLKGLLQRLTAGDGLVVALLPVLKVVGPDAHSGKSFGHRPAGGEADAPVGAMFLQPVSRAAAVLPGSAKTSLVPPSRSSSPLSMMHRRLHIR